jgi:hypothetical protein
MQCAASGWVLTGLMGWGDVQSEFTLAVFLYLPTDVESRIIERDDADLNLRIEVGGDMYDTNLAFGVNSQIRHSRARDAQSNASRTMVDDADLPGAAIRR